LKESGGFHENTGLSDEERQGPGEINGPCRILQEATGFMTVRRSDG
jgi:hypothetical protein